MSVETSPPSMDEPSDETLWQAFREQGDETAFATLVHRYERPLFNYLARYTGDPNQAEELFQATFERVFEHRQQFEPGRRFRPWVYSIATHQAIDALRHAGRHKPLEFDAASDDHDTDTGKLFNLLSDDEPSPLAQLETAERRDWVRLAVSRLPENLRSVVLMAYYDGMTLSEVAETLHQPLGTVKSRLHKALLLLNADWKRGHRLDAA